MANVVGPKVRADRNRLAARPFPYKKFEGTANWRRTEKAIRDLVQNGDLIEKTKQKYIVGYICSMLFSGQTE